MEASHNVEHKPTAFDSPEYWGSTEEYEIQQILQQIISSSLDSKVCKQVLSRLYEYLQTASDGWVDRFSVCQGTLVLTKLLTDINSSHKYMQLRDLSEYVPETMERELALVDCLSMLFSRSTVAKELAVEDRSQSTIQTLLRSAISPNERTRQVASATLQRLKRLESSSNVLHILTVYRSPSSNEWLRSNEDELDEFSESVTDDANDEFLKTKSNWYLNDMPGSNSELSAAGFSIEDYFAHD